MHARTHTYTNMEIINIFTPSADKGIEAYR